MKGNCVLLSIWFITFSVSEESIRDGLRWRCKWEYMVCKVEDDLVDYSNNSFEGCSIWASPHITPCTSNLEVNSSKVHPYTPAPLGSFPLVEDTLETLALVAKNICTRFEKGPHEGYKSIFFVIPTMSFLNHRLSGGAKLNVLDGGPSCQLSSLVDQVWWIAPHTILFILKVMHLSIPQTQHVKIFLQNLSSLIL